MRAAVLHAPRDLRIEEVESPAPGPGEILLRVEAALAGGSAGVLSGREVAGTVAALGEGVRGVQVGERVVPADSAACGRCEACQRGMGAQCAATTRLPPAWAEAIVVPAAIVAGNLHRIPKGMDPAAAALSADLACVLKAFDRSPVRAGEHAVVLGAGAMGLLWTRLLSVAGATVTAVDPHPDRRERARALGAAEVLDSGAFEESVGRGERRSEAVVDAVGTPQAWEIALRAAAPGGRVHLFGSPAAGARAAIDTARLHRDELLLVGSFHHTPYHFAEALRGLAQGFVDPSVVVPERVPLAHLPAFLLRTFQGGGPPRAAVVP